MHWASSVHRQQRHCAHERSFTDVPCQTQPGTVMSASTTLLRGGADRASRGARLLKHAVPYPEQGALAQGVLRQVQGSGQLCCVPRWPLLRTIHFFSTKARCSSSCEGRLHPGAQQDGSHVRNGQHTTCTVGYGDSCGRQSPSVQVAIYKFKGQEVFHPLLCICHLKIAHRLKAKGASRAFRGLCS